MGSKIEWTNRTWNPTTGCTYYSSAKNGGNECLNCYSEVLTNRLQAMGQEKYKQGFDVFVEHEDVLDEPYSWKQPSTVFVNSMSDLLHLACSDDFIKKAFKVVNDTPQHTYQILTKRHERLEKLPADLVWSDNIWMGVSCGNQYATKRIPSLVQSKAKHKFLSVEPFIQEITEIDLTGINWVIVGGESGNNSYKIEKDEKGKEKYQIVNGRVVYTFVLDENGRKILEKKIRPLKKEWVEVIKDKCEQQNIPFFFKQWGKVKNNPNRSDPTLNKEHRYYAKGGCQLNGKIYWANPTMEDDSTPMINLFAEDFYIMDEFEELHTIWELKSYLPKLEKDLFSQLKENIKQNDLNDPILYYVTAEGKKLVIDGHNRLKACIELKKKNVPTKEIKENFSNLDDIKLWMIKQQCERRNLSKIEMIQLAYLSKPTIEKLAKENLCKAGKANSKKNTESANSEEIKKIDTYFEIAKIAHVGRTTVYRYSLILNSAPQTVIDSVNKGDISIGSAYASLKNKIEPVIDNTDKKYLSILPLRNNRQPVANSLKNETIPIESADTPQKIKKEAIKENKITEIEPKRVGRLQDNLIILQNIDDGQQKIKNGDIDVMMIFNQSDKLNILEKNPDVRIGVYYLD
jgi:protein gp37